MVGGQTRRRTDNTDRPTGKRQAQHKTIHPSQPTLPTHPQPPNPKRNSAHLRGRRRLPPATHHPARGGEVVQESAGRAVGGVDGAQESPGLREKLPDGRGLHGREELPSVDAAEVRQVAEEVDTLRHDREPRHLFVVFVVFHVSIRCLVVYIYFSITFLFCFVLYHSVPI